MSITQYHKNGVFYPIEDTTARENIGDLSQLKTTAKGSLVEALNEARESGGGGGSIPSFDLAALGLPALTMDGTEVGLEDADLTQLGAAMDNGPVKLVFSLNLGEAMPVAAVVNPMVIVGTGEYECVIPFYFDGSFKAVFMITPADGHIAAMVVANQAQEALTDAEGVGF